MNTLEHQAVCSVVVLAAAIAFFQSCTAEEQPRVGTRGLPSSPVFSPDGSYMLVSVSHINLAGKRVNDTIDVFEAGSWELVQEFHSDLSITQPFMCGSNDLVFMVEVDFQTHTSNLEARSIAGGLEKTRIPIDPYFGPSTDPEAEAYSCDSDSGIFYILIRHNKVTAIDGRTGVLTREYYAEEGEAPDAFIVQKAGDRLLFVDKPGEQVFVFRLSTGELLGKVKVWDTDPYPLDHFQDHALVDEDHLLYYIYGSKEGTDGVHFFLVDLEQRVVVSESCLRDYYPSGMDVMGTADNTVLMSIHHPGENVSTTAAVDYLTGEIKHSVGGDFIGFGGMTPLPEIGRVYFDDWSIPLEEAAWVFTYPDFMNLHRGPAPIAADDKHWVSRGKLLVMSNSRDEFGVYDPVNFRVLDAFRICQNTQYGTRIDPQERWAAVVCAGYPMDTQLKPGQAPDGAGVAIVELDRYR